MGLIVNLMAIGLKRKDTDINCWKHSILLFSFPAALQRRHNDIIRPGFSIVFCSCSFFFLWTLSLQIKAWSKAELQLHSKWLAIPVLWMLDYVLGRGSGDLVILWWEGSEFGVQGMHVWVHRLQNRKWSMDSPGHILISCHECVPRIL